MQEYGKFLLLCLKWSYGRWQKGERMVTSALILVTLLGITGFTLGIVQWGRVVYLLAIPIVLIFSVAPYKLWKRANDRVIELTTKKLEVKFERQAEPHPPRFWWHFIVRNPNSIPIEDCYGQLLSFIPNKNNSPYQGLRLPWSSWTTRDMEKYTIPGRASGRLDFIVTSDEHLVIVGLSTEEAKRTFLQAEPLGEYMAEIQVGSHKQAFEPTKVKMRIVFSGGVNLEVKMDEEEQGNNLSSIPQG